jgi:hypothetical protein
MTAALAAKHGHGLARLLPFLPANFRATPADGFYLIIGIIVLLLLPRVWRALI